MINIIVSSSRIKETHIIHTAFEQYGYNIVSMELNYENYLKCIQIKPDIFLINIPYACEQEMKLIKTIQRMPNSKLVIIGYGPGDITLKSRFFDRRLLTEYLTRPLKFSLLLEIIKDKFPQRVEEIEANQNALDEPADYNALKDKKLPQSVKLHIIVQHASHFIAFPFTLPKVLAITSDPMSGAGELAKTIETDPVIASQVLKTANTIFYAPSDHRITKMRDAIVRIGFNETKRLALCIEVMKLFENKQRSFGFNRTQFWLHSIATAVAVELIFGRGDFKQLSEHAFLTGLLHDFGTIVLDEFIPDIFCEVLEKTVSTSGEFSDQFEQLMGFPPSQIPQEFMRQWNFHNLIIEGMRFKTAPITDNQSTEQRLRQALLLAHSLVKSLQIGRSCDLFINAVPSEIPEELGFMTGIPNSLIDKLYFKVRELCSFLKLAPEMVHNRYMENATSTDNPEICYFSVGKELFSPHYICIAAKPIPSRKVGALSYLKNVKSNPTLLVISLDDTSEESALAFLNSEEFNELTVGNILLITEHITAVREAVKRDQTAVIPRGVDARLFSKVLLAYFNDIIES